MKAALIIALLFCALPAHTGGWFFAAGAAASAPPTLEAEGTTLGNTAGTLSPTIPTHQANDILVLTVAFWGPSPPTEPEQIPTPTDWNLAGTQIAQPASPVDGWLAVFWLRATGSGTTVTISRGASWDTALDTCFGARVYVVRGCTTSGNPFDAVGQAGPYTTANQNFPAVTVSGSARTVIQFGCSTDDQTFAMTSGGWTTGTASASTQGTDCTFNSARQSNVSSSTSADAATVSAPAQGAYAFYGISFKP